MPTLANLQKNPSSKRSSSYMDDTAICIYVGSSSVLKMFPALQLRSIFWRYLRLVHNVLRTPIPTARILSYPFIRNTVYDGLFNAEGGLGRVTTAVDAVNFFLLSSPTRWSLPVPLLATGIVVAVTMAINTWVLFDVTADLASNNEMFTIDPKCQSTTFDYVVVGAGTAGLIAATRIANASRNIRVLLLEAGGEPSVLNDIPFLDLFLANQLANTWAYQSIPQQHVCQLCNGRRTVTRRGKMLGGSSSTNFMLYARGHKEDFNSWAIDAQDDQWNYENVLPYFKKSENYNGEYANELSSDTYHGKDGLLNVATHKFMPGVDDFLAAGVEKGFSIGDYNGEEQEVFSKMDVTTQNGWRESVYRAFYQDTGKPPNLCIKKYAHVTKINFQQMEPYASIRATGVTYNRHNLTRSVFASKEVIVSAGAIESAKLLLISGVGPLEELQALGIPVVADVPVGKNLQDSPYVLVGPFLKGPSSNPNRDYTVKSVAAFLTSEDGAVAAPGGYAGHAFFQSPFAQPKYPDLQAIQFSISLHPELPHHLKSMLGVKESVLRKWLNPYYLQNVDARFVVVILGRPKSVGRLLLTSANPSDEMYLDPNYLSHEDDREALLYGMKKVVDLFENTTVLNTPLFPVPLPGCEFVRFKSDTYYKCVIKSIADTFHHHIGTCALGKVVDSHLRVKGIDNMRVIDASVIPTANGNSLAATTIMIGEKGADLVISDMRRRMW